MMFFTTIAYIYYNLYACNNCTVYITQCKTTCSMDNPRNVPNNPLGVLPPSILTTGCYWKVHYLFEPCLVSHIVESIQNLSEMTNICTCSYNCCICIYAYTRMHTKRRYSHSYTLLKLQHSIIFPPATHRRNTVEL